MALAETTLSAALGAGGKVMTVASATSFAAGRIAQINGEIVQVSKDYVSGSTSVPILRGQLSTLQVAHPSSARVVHGDPSDFGQGIAGSPYSPYGRVRRTESYSAAGAITLPKPGEDVVAILNGTGALAMTIAVPSKDLDGCILNVVGDGAAAHTLTFSGGLSGAGSSYDVITANATGQVWHQFIAMNEVWVQLVATPMAGTVTNVTSTVS
jgi:hypothetical protein